MNRHSTSNGHVASGLRHVRGLTISQALQLSLELGIGEAFAGIQLHGLGINLSGYRPPSALEGLANTAIEIVEIATADQYGQQATPKHCF